MANTDKLVRSVEAQYAVSNAELDRINLYGFAVDAVIRNRLIERMAAYILEHAKELCSMEARPASPIEATVFSVRANFISDIGVSLLRDVVKILQSREVREALRSLLEKFEEIDSSDVDGEEE